MQSGRAHRTVGPGRGLCRKWRGTRPPCKRGRPSGGSFGRCKEGKAGGQSGEAAVVQEEM